MRLPASPCPASPAASSLRVSADVNLGAASASARDTLVATEAPDGAVFYADGNVVMVVDGDSPPQAAEHPGAQVLGLGASATTLYVVTPGSAGAIATHTSVAQPVTVAGTSSGLLFLTCAKQACSTVTKVDQSSGKTTKSVTVPVSGEILLGPSPVVLGEQAGDLRLVRLG